MFFSTPLGLFGVSDYNMWGKGLQMVLLKFQYRVSWEINMQSTRVDKSWVKRENDHFQPFVKQKIA